MLKKVTLCLLVSLVIVAARPSRAAEEWISCDPVEVANYENRIHVRCAAAVGGIRFFARSNSNAADVSRYLSTLLAAQIAGRTLSILYDPSDTSGASIGCAESDCRILLAATFGN
jgi:hypothetical protein